MTFRVGEEEEEAEAGAPREEATNLSTKVGVDQPIVKGIDPPTDQMTEGRGSIKSGMQAKQQDPAQVYLMRRKSGKNIRKTWGKAKREKIETPKGISQKNLKTGREQGVPVPEGRDPIEGT